MLCFAGKATVKPSSLSKALTIDPVLGSTQRVHVQIPRRTSPHRSPCCKTAAFDNRAIDELSVGQTHPQPYTKSVHHRKAMYYSKADLKKSYWQRAYLLQAAERYFALRRPAFHRQGRRSCNTAGEDSRALCEVFDNDEGARKTRV